MPATEGDAEKANAENRTHCQKKAGKYPTKINPKIYRNCKATQKNTIRDGCSTALYTAYTV